MAKFELCKSIEATPLNKRTWIPTSDPPVTIPFGAIIEHTERDRDYDKFVYLGQPYRCPHDILKAAVRQPVSAVAPDPTPAPPSPAPADAPAERVCLVWEELPSSHFTLRRAKVPGGWLVAIGIGGDGIAFYPDPQHAWDGTSLP